MANSQTQKIKLVTVPTFRPFSPEFPVHYMVDSGFLHGLRRLLEYKSQGKEDLLDKLGRLSASNGGFDELIKLFDFSTQRMAGIVESGKLHRTGRDRHLREKARDYFLASCDRLEPYFSEEEFKDSVSDTDLTHTIASLGYLFDICEQEGMPPSLQKIVVSAMIVHDCAYPLVESYDHFVSGDMRKVHMDNAVGMFRQWAAQTDNFSGFYTQDDTDQVVGIIGQHDIPSLKVDFDYSKVSDPCLIFAHREADRLWMLDRGGFTLDLFREMAEKSRYDPKARLEHVIDSHKKESDIYGAYYGLCRHFDSSPTIYRTESGFQIFQHLIKQVQEDYSLDH